MKWLADLVGLLALAVIIGVLAALAPQVHISAAGWLAIFAVLGIAALPAWHGKSAPKRPAEWAQLLGWTVLADALSFLVDVLIGSAGSAGGSWLQRAEHSASPFGFGLTSIIIPAAFVIFAAGFVRAVFLVGVANRTAAHPDARS